MLRVDRSIEQLHVIRAHRVEEYLTPGAIGRPLTYGRVKRVMHVEAEAEPLSVDQFILPVKILAFVVQVDCGTAYHLLFREFEVY